MLKNKLDQDVLYSQTGAHFETIGVLTIAPDGKISNELVSVKEYGKKNPAVQAVIDQKKKAYADLGARKIGHSEVMLPAKDKNGDWLVRKYETSLGDLCADAFRITLGTDIAMLGGGSIRKDLPEGDLRYDDIFNVFPFGNTVCTASLTGQQILDALEFGVGAWPTDFGGFLHVSGMTYEFDPSVESPVVYDVNKSFVRIDAGPRRVFNVRILDPETGNYEPLDPTRTYTVGGTTYLLRDAGDGYEMLKGLGHDTGTPDLDLLEKYIVDHLHGDIRTSQYGESQQRIKQK